MGGIVTSNSPQPLFLTFTNLFSSTLLTFSIFFFSYISKRCQISSSKRPLNLLQTIFPSLSQKPSKLPTMATYNDLKGKTFVITGAASGMGRTTSLMLAEQGANIGLLDLRKPDNTLAEIEAMGGRAISLACNVQDRSAVHSAIKSVSDKFGGINGAANMAGYVGNQGLHGKGYALDVIMDEDWDGMLATNLNGVKNCIRAELNFIKDGGSIVNAASIAGQYGPPYNAPYAVSKWGVIALTKCCAAEVGARNVRVNAVAP